MVTYSFSNKAKKQVKKINKKGDDPIEQLIAKKFSRIENIYDEVQKFKNPNLKGFYYKLGNYRLYLEIISNKQVMFWNIVPRKEAYLVL